MSQIEVGPRLIGPKCAPFIIAEIGSNWISIEDCLNSISSASSHGADAVKFQLFTEQELYGYEPQLGHMPGQLDPEWLPKLREKAEACKIRLLCSAFSPKGFDLIAPHVDAVKIASAEAMDGEILMAAKKTGKPIFISTGAMHWHEVPIIKKMLPMDRTVLMYCVGEYPATMTDLELIGRLRDEMQVPFVGYSDHSLDVGYMAKSAVLHYKAIAIEKHVNFVGAIGPDAEHSLSGDGFQMMCKMVRGAKTVMSASESMVLKHRRRLIATREIVKGASFNYGDCGNFGSYRSLEDDTKGMLPEAAVQIDGKAAMRDIKQGEAIGPSDFER